VFKVVLNIYFRVSELSEALDKAIVVLNAYETWSIQNLSEHTGDGFVSHDPEAEIISMIYNQPSRYQIEVSTHSEATAQMIASLEEITVTQKVIGKKND